MSERHWLFPPDGIDPELGHYEWASEEERSAYARWMEKPRIQREAIFLARLGLMSGDLQPLATLMRAGFPLDASIVCTLADAIEGQSEHGLRLTMTLAPGQKSFHKTQSARDRDFKLGWRVETLRSQARASGETGVSDSIFAQVAEEFGVRPSTVKNAWRARQK